MSKYYLSDQRRSYQRINHNYHNNYVNKSEENSYFYANHKFLVSNWSEDLLSDPNFRVPWEDIDGVIVESTESSTCPICLDEPTVPRTDACGHVYCYHCLLQYFSSLKNPSKAKCTICMHQIELVSVKRAIIKKKEPLKVGDELEFVKVSKYPNSIIIYQDDDAPNWSFSRFKPSSPKQINKMLNNELNEVKNLITVYQMEGFGADETIPFLRNVSNKLREDMALMKKRPADSNPHISIPEKRLDFYQEKNGRDIYIDSFSWKLITSHYTLIGQDVPNTLTLKVDDIKRQSMDYDIRKRYKHLSHLPDSREFIFAEVCVEGLVDPVVLESFMDKINKRKSLRLEREEMDRILEQKRIEEENRLPHLPVGFKLCGPVKLNLEEDFVPLSVSNPSSSVNNSQKAKTSFAAVTKNGAMNAVGNNRIGKWTKNGNVAWGKAAVDVKLTDFK